MRIALIKVPDFKKEANQEDKPDLYYKMNPEQQREYDKNRAAQLGVAWSCKTSAASMNLSIVLLVLYFLTNGLQLFNILTAILKNKIGVP